MSGNGLSILSDIIIPIMVIIKGVLDNFVDAASGNALTITGYSFVGAMATIILHVTEFIAQLSTLFPAQNGIS